MKRISFNDRFVNEKRDNLIPGKIHTVRENYDFWKRFEGKDLALFYWIGKPYQKGSTQKVFCIKRLVYVQKVEYCDDAGFLLDNRKIDINYLSKNDGFKTCQDFIRWFKGYPDGDMAILHFTDYRYRY